MPSKEARFLLVPSRRRSRPFGHPVPAHTRTKESRPMAKESKTRALIGRLALGALITATIGLASADAGAAVISAMPNADFSGAPVTISFGTPGQASYTFSYIGTAPFDPNPDAVTTGGTALVASLGPPFYNPPQPTSYFAGALIDAATLAQFLAYSSPAAIP